MNAFQPSPTNSKESAHALDLLEEFISQISDRPSHWFLINSPGNNDYDLRNLLGMTENEYIAFLLSIGLYKRDKNDDIAFAKHPWEMFLTRFDKSVVEVIPSVIELPPVKKRMRYYAIRIGDKNKVKEAFGNKRNTFPSQLKLQMPTPHPPRSLQRQLKRDTGLGIIARIIREKDLYEQAMNALDAIGKKTSAATLKGHLLPGVAASSTKSTSKTSEAKTPAASSTTSSTTAPPPTKKQRVENPPSQSSDHSEDETSLPCLSGYSDLQAAVEKLSKSLTGHDENVITKDIDSVYAIMTQLKQDGPVINYKDKMHKNVSLIRVPVATTDASYNKSNDWIASALQINGKGDTESSSRRIMRQLIKSNENSAHAALEKEGINVTKQMNETKLAAMFQDGNLNDTQQRKVLKYFVT